MKDWKWFGKAGHFICGEYCRFHLCTQIGRYLISTVGEYFPDSQVREIMATSRGIVLDGRGDERRYNYMEKIGYADIGYGRKYETMVFKTKGLCECGCGQPKIDPSELDFAGYNKITDATDGHMAMCRKWARKRKHTEKTNGRE